MTQPVRRTLEEILIALQSGQLDYQDVTMAEVVTIEKFDKSGDVPRLFETRTVTKVEGREAEVVIVKH